MREAENQYDRICRSEFEEINGKLDRIDVSLRGNGKIGIITRLDRLERAAQMQSKMMWIILVSLMTAAATWVFTVI
jgi:hypothetical protein